MPAGSSPGRGQRSGDSNKQNNLMLWSCGEGRGEDYRFQWIIFLYLSGLLASAQQHNKRCCCASASLCFLLATVSYTLETKELATALAGSRTEAGSMDPRPSEDVLNEKPRDEETKH